MSYYRFGDILITVHEIEGVPANLLTRWFNFLKPLSKEDGDREVSSYRPYMREEPYTSLFKIWNVMRNIDTRSNLIIYSPDGDIQKMWTNMHAISVDEYLHDTTMHEIIILSPDPSVDDFVQTENVFSRLPEELWPQLLGQASNEDAGAIFEAMSQSEDLRAKSVMKEQTINVTHEGMVKTLEFWDEEKTQLQSITYINPVDGNFHREFGMPAMSKYSETGQLVEEGWFVNGVNHRDDGPAIIQYGDDGSRKEYWIYNGQRYRDNGAAYIQHRPDGTLQLQVWSELYDDEIAPLINRFPIMIGEFNYPHRDELPAVVEYNENQRPIKVGWFQQGMPYRKGGPATIALRDDGIIEKELWYEIPGLLHRRDALLSSLPAITEYYQGTDIVQKEQWFYKGARVRSIGDDDPEIVEYHIDGTVKKNTWYFNGVIGRVVSLITFPLPAIIEYDMVGEGRSYNPNPQQTSSWFVDGVLTRTKTEPLNWVGAERNIPHRIYFRPFAILMGSIFNRRH